MDAPGRVSFKAYLREKGSNSPKEVRRFGMEQSEVVSFNRLKTKLQQVFPSLGNLSYTVKWKDADGDDIIISSDEELLTALTESNEQVRRLYLDVSSDSSSFTFHPSIEIIPVGFGDGDDAESGGDDEITEIHVDSWKPATGFSVTPKEHFRVVCDGCNTKITSHRYKCVECPDYDLCLSCESRGLHSDHIMVRIPLCNSLAGKHPYFMKGLALLKDAVRKIQHRRRKNERRFSKMAGVSGDCLYKMANNYFMDWEKCMREAKHDKPERKSKRGHCFTSSDPQDTCGSSSTPQAPPPTDNTSNPQPSTSQGQGTCPIGTGLISSLLNKDNLDAIQHFLERISPVPEALLQELAKSLADTNLSTEQPATSADAPPASKPSSPADTPPAEPVLMETAAPSTSSAAEKSVPQTTEDSTSPVVVSPRSSSVERDSEGWMMVVDPQAADNQDGQPVYPKLPSFEQTPVNVAQPQSYSAPVQHRDPAVQICLERLGRMGYNVDDQFTVELAEAHHGDLSRVLDLLG